MALPNKSPGQVSALAKCIVLVSQLTIVVGSFGAVFLLTRLLSDTALPQAAQVQIGPAENLSEMKVSPEFKSSTGNADQRKPVNPLVEETKETVEPARSPIGNAVPGSAPIVSGFVQTDAPDKVTRPPDLPAGQDPPEPGSALRASETAEKVSPEEHTQAAHARTSSDGPEEASAGKPVTPIEAEATAHAHDQPTGSTVPTTHVQAAAAAGAPVPDARAGKQKATAKTSNRTDAQRAESRGFQSSQAKSQPINGTAEAERRNEKRGQRTRTAAVQQQEPPVPPPAAPAAQPTQERIRLLGIPMPTGTELKQCLLEFRC